MKKVEMAELRAVEAGSHPISNSHTVWFALPGFGWLEVGFVQDDNDNFGTETESGNGCKYKFGWNFWEYGTDGTTGSWKCVFSSMDLIQLFRRRHS